MKKVFKTDFLGRELCVEVGELAQMANGSVFISYGDTQILVNACMSKEAKEGIDFFPLSVFYEEKMYSVGKIPGGFLKREGRASEKATLTCRLIDRPLRPLFDKGFRNDVQIVATVMGVDQDNSPEITSILGASLALGISDIPFDGPVGAVNVGLIDGELVYNPTSDQRDISDLSLTVAGTSEAVLMVEAGANEVSEEIMIDAIMGAHEHIKEIIKFQEEIIKEVGVEKADITYYRTSEEIKEKIYEEAKKGFREAYDIHEKQAREDRVEEVKAEILDKYLEEYPDNKLDFEEIFAKLLKEIVRGMITNEGIRPDGRKVDEIRPVTCEVGKIRRAHGSGLFTRGQTQVMSMATLGAIRDEQIIDGIGEETSKKYIHHYNFPAYSVGETGPMRGPGRREIGHGALAERALLPVIPDQKDFPYTIRVVSEVLASNGSTSQASVCGSTLSLMDAGVPIKAPVAGIAMGLIKEENKVSVLSDIQGVEDFYGDMDFKVAGTSEGITAIQMDIKIKGIDKAILTEALARAKKGRFHILGKMEEAITAPREDVSKYAPKIMTMKIAEDKIKDVIGPGGKMINKIIDETGVKIDILDDGQTFVSAVDLDDAKKAVQIIEDITREVEEGDTYVGKVARVMDFGAFVEIPGGKEGLVHISKIAHERVNKVTDVLNVGDEVNVKVIEIDKQGRINLSRKALLPKPKKEVKENKEDKKEEKVNE